MKAGVKSPWKRIFGKLLLSLGGVAIGLALCEIVLRLFFPGYSPLFLDIYRLDEHGLLALKPGVIRQHLTNEWNVTVAINSDGFRDRTTPVPDQGGRALVLGDSFAFGWGTELPQSFVYLAEESLRPDAIRLVKAGIPGTGTSDQAAWLNTYGESYKPNLVIIAFFVGNDFVDVAQGGAAGQFTIADGLMQRRSLTGDPPSWFSRAKDKIKRSSRVSQKVLELSYTYGWNNSALLAHDPWQQEFFKIHLRTPPPETTAAVDLTLHALQEIRDWSLHHTVPMLVMLIPRSFQIYDWELTEWMKNFGFKDDEIDLDRPQRIVSDWAASRGEAVLDLLPLFRARHQSQPEERLYFHPDGHLNVKGHRLTSEKLAESIRRLLGTAPKSIPVSSRAD